MNLFEPLEELEQKELRLQQQVKALPANQRKQYYQLQCQQIKDPDTYATLNWFCLGGFHHCYLRKYGLFMAEFAVLSCALVGFFLGYSASIYLLILLLLFELPQLFFSQKIARQYNYRVACDILNNVQTDTVTKQ